jgi:two-component system sensor histidine kinase VanS
VDLSLVAEEATELLVPLAEKQGVAITTSGEVTPTVGSHPLLVQMAANLVHNAIVHNLREHGTVHIETAAAPECMTLAVETTGERVSPHLVPTLVEPFQRGGARVRDDHAGVGLGLAIVKSIAEAHDGTLAIEPRTGGGLRVIVRLPAAASHGEGGRYGRLP